MTSLAHPAASIEKSQLLRTMLRSDGIFSATVGAVFVAASNAVAALVGMSDGASLTIIGVVLMLYGASMFYYSRLPQIPHWYAWLSTEIDFGWGVASVIVALTGAMGLNTTGSLSVLVTAIAVFGVSALKYIGLRRMQA